MYSSRLIKNKEKDVDTFISEHNHINYCEAIILKNGYVKYAIPSHCTCLAFETNLRAEDINKLMPITAAPINWLIEYTGIISVWTDGYLLPKKCSDEQIQSLKKLIDNNLVCNKLIF